MEPERREQVEKWAADRYLATDEHHAAYLTDSLSHAQLKQIVQTAVRTDEAMRLEGIGEGVRDQVLYRLLYGDDPGSSYEPPDFAGAEARMQDRINAMRYALTTISWAGARPETFEAGA